MRLGHWWMLFQCNHWMGCISTFLLISIWMTDGLASEAKDLSDQEFEDEFALLEEEDKVYTASKHKQDIFDSPSTITVITREQIENSPCTDIACLLSVVPELEVRILQPLWQSVGARTLADEASDKGLVLVDGQDCNLESIGVPFWAGLPVHLSDIQRVEIIRGPGSALYGANAQSMVISIITRKPKDNRAEVYLMGGERASWDTNLRWDGQVGSWRYQLTGGMELADHWRQRDNQEKEVYRAHFRLAKEWGDSSMELQATALIHNGMLFNTVAPLRIPNFNQLAINGWFENSWLRSRVWASTYVTDLCFDLPLYYNGIKLGEFPKAIGTQETTADGEVQVKFNLWEGNLLLAGSNYRLSGFFMDQNDRPSVYQHRMGVFVQDEQRLWERLLISGAVRLDYNTITNFTVSPRLAFSWRWTPGQVVRLAVGQAFHLPAFMYTSLHLTTVKGTASFPELTEFFKRNLGNDDLGNERITAIETGYRGEWIDGRLIAESDIFYNFHRGTISWFVDIATNSLGLPDLQHSRMQKVNVGTDVDAVGGSLSLTYRLPPGLWFNVNYTYRFSRQLNTPGDNTDVMYAQGSRVPWEPAHLFNVVGYYHFSNGVRVGLNSHARSAYQIDRTQGGGVFGQKVWIDIPASLYINLLVAWRLELERHWIEVGLRIFDLLNHGFTDSANVTRFDGKELGGELLQRKAWLYLSGSF